LDTGRTRVALACASGACLVAAMLAATTEVHRPRLEFIATVQSGLRSAAPPPAVREPASEPPPSTGVRAAAPLRTTTSAPRRPSPAQTLAPVVDRPATNPVATSTTLPARAEPTGAEMSHAIALFHERIPLYRPSEDQVRRFGDALCTALDQGRTYAELAAAVQKAAGQIPLVRVSAADVNLAIRTIVAMFCPGYEGQLQ
jgi:hypothetical protein